MKKSNINKTDAGSLIKGYKRFVADAMEFFKPSPQDTNSSQLTPLRNVLFSTHALAPPPVKMDHERDPSRGGRGGEETIIIH
jgi:hypothetical protein